MELPKYHEIFTPILDILSDGNVYHYNVLYKKVRDKFYSGLPLELLNKTIKSGDNLLLNRIGWGSVYLKQGKFIDRPERGMVQITEKGKRAFAKGKLTAQDMKTDPDFVAYIEQKKQEKEGVEVSVENASPEDMIDSGFTAIESKVKNDLLDKLKEMDPYLFEKVILILLEKMGYGDFIETSKSGDGGIDGVINQDKLGLEKIYIQAKRYSENKIREPAIRNFIGAMAGGTTKGIFVTTSEFDESAISRVREIPTTIILIDGNQLADLMHRYNVGVQIKNTYEVKQVDEDFFENV